MSVHCVGVIAEDRWKEEDKSEDVSDMYNIAGTARTQVTNEITLSSRWARGGASHWAPPGRHSRLSAPLAAALTFSGDSHVDGAL